jgi:hypothetical protein
VHSGGYKWYAVLVSKKISALLLIVKSGENLPRNTQNGKVDAHLIIIAPTDFFNVYQP